MPRSVGEAGSHDRPGSEDPGPTLGLSDQRTPDQRTRDTLAPMRTTVLFLAMAMWSAVAQDAPFQVGFADIDITPPAGYRMDGYFYERLNTGVRDPLQAKA